MDYKKLMENLSKDTLKLVIEDLLEQALFCTRSIDPPPLPPHVARQMEVVKAGFQFMTTQELTEYARQLRKIMDAGEVA